MSSNDYTKTCPVCGKTKPHTEFYSHNETPDGLNWHCKACNLAYSNDYYSRRAKVGKLAVEPESTRLVRAILIRHDISCTTGREAGMPWVDLAAFGYVPIEAKLAHRNPRPSGLSFAWRLSYKQRRGIPGLVVFVGIDGPSQYTYIVPGNDDKIFTTSKGTRCTGLRVTVDSNSEKSRLFAGYRDRFDLIYKYGTLV